ncbi:3-hydroxyacyl-CoA dehydrogenase NAD-binding domain-containing protein [Pseudogemmobacter sonorensis]|uniref:3-hydroxyacyl-CoA dehydrogenase n=1 Tax=Pseudogemmobacter sonorensis TaxID=2989681 RepID=UPI0036BA3D58
MDRSASIARAGVVGSGTMGGGIAMAYANAGIQVTLLDAEGAALERGLGIIAKNYRRSVERGRLDPAEAEARIARITGTLEIGDLAGSDIVTEAIFEDMVAKLDLVRRLDDVLAPGAIIASNTSTLDIDQIAAASRHPARVLGMHYFSPANVMKLLEVVRGKATSAEVVARAAGIGRLLGKVPVVVGVCFGFVGNRMLFARAAQSERMLLEGATPSQNDAALTAFGFPMGQHAMMDLSGLDVEWRIRQPRGEVRPVSDALVAMGRHGQKSGAGFYRYAPGGREALADPEVEALCRRLGAELGHRPRGFTGAELLERQLYPLVNEGIRILEEGIADSAGDIDTIWRHGYGWPADKTGPMAWAETIGAPALVAALDRMAEETGDETLRPAESLRRAAAAGGRIFEDPKGGAA